MTTLFILTEEDISRGLRARNLPIEALDDLTKVERQVVEEYVGLVFRTAKRELLDMLAQAIRRSRGFPS